MDVATTRFGSLRVDCSDCLCFPNGLPGFEDCRDWVLIVESPDRAVGWLQSATWPDLAVPVTSPRRFVADYEVRLDPVELSPLGLDCASEAQILVMVAVHGDAYTLNLKAPLAINMRRRLGRQVLNGGDWALQHVIARRPALLRRTA
jgi:flagellar assembly factor FliW